MKRTTARPGLLLAAMVGIPIILSPLRARAGNAGAPASADAPSHVAKVRPAPALAVHATEELASLIPKLAHGRPLLLHFCATWCEACRSELKSLHGLFEGLDARGVSFALVWIDDEKTRAAIPKMTARYHLGGLPALILDAPDPAPVSKALQEPKWDGSLPATFVYGIHQEKLASFDGAADPTLLRAAIDEALRRAK